MHSQTSRYLLEFSPSIVLSARWGFPVIFWTPVVKEIFSLKICIINGSLILLLSADVIVFTTVCPGVFSSAFANAPSKRAFKSLSTIK